MADIRKPSGILTKECLRTQICGNHIYVMKILLFFMFILFVLKEKANGQKIQFYINLMKQNKFYYPITQNVYQ